VRSSLNTWILVLILGLVVLVIGAMGIANYRAGRDEVLATALDDAADRAEMVDSILHAAMLIQSPGAITRLVGDMTRSRQVVGIAIYNAKEQPAFRTTTKPLSPAGKKVLATRTGLGGQEDVGGRPTYRVFRPITTSAECYGCHKKDDPIAGVIQVDLSLERGYERVAVERNRALQHGLVLVGILTLVLWVFMSRTLVRPLRAMVRSAGSIAAGDLSERVAPGGVGEIGALATSFNVMADELQGRILDLEEAREKVETSIHRVAEALSSALDVTSIIQILITESMSVGKFQLGFVSLADGTRHDIVMPTEGDGDPDGAAAEGAAAVRALRAQLEKGSSLLSTTRATRILYRSTDKQVQELGLSSKWETVAVVPMLWEGRLVGHLVLVSATHVTLDTAQRRTLAFLGAQGAAAVTNSHLHERAREMAITDGLTGLFDHRHFYETLETEMARAARYGLFLGLVLLDIDHFKQYNDRAGHRNGDLLLRRLAAVLRAAVRKTDVVARYGGEEFAVILPHTGPAKALVLAERIRLAVEQEPFSQASGQQLGRVTVSVGVASRPDDAETVEALVERADAALYAAKHRGRNRVVAYERLRAERRIGDGAPEI
jgi:diguanylate cyclase (GGDEF)-like protein